MISTTILILDVYKIQKKIYFRVESKPGRSPPNRTYWKYNTHIKYSLKITRIPFHLFIPHIFRIIPFLFVDYRYRFFMVSHCSIRIVYWPYNEIKIFTFLYYVPKLPTLKIDRFYGLFFYVLKME